MENVFPHVSTKFRCQLKSVEEEQKEEISTGVDGTVHPLVSAFWHWPAQIPSTPGVSVLAPTGSNRTSRIDISTKRAGASEAAGSRHGCRGVVTET